MDEGKIVTESLEETSGQLADVNRERMNEGIKADGSVMPNYSYISQTVYGYPDEPIKLRATGAFQEGIHVDVEGDKILTDSSDEKSEMLKGRYGEEIMGLTAETKYSDKSEYFKGQYLDNNLRPVVNRKITEATGLRFAV